MQVWGLFITRLYCKAAINAFSGVAGGAMTSKLGFGKGYDGICPLICEDGTVPIPCTGDSSCPFSGSGGV